MIHRHYPECYNLLNLHRTWDEIVLSNSRVCSGIILTELIIFFLDFDFRNPRIFPTRKLSLKALSKHITSLFLKYISYCLDSRSNNVIISIKKKKSPVLFVLMY